MPVTLAQAQLNTQDKIVKGVIDEFRKSSFILDNIPFDNAVAPTGQGATLTYGYTRVVTEGSAHFRAVNTEYLKHEATKQRYTVDLKIFGGAFEIDRVLTNLNAFVNEVDFQVAQKVKAARALFHDAVINGDTGLNPDTFDGLNKALTGSSTELTPGAAIDLSTSAAIDTNYKAFMDELDNFLSLLADKPSFLGGNSKLITKIKQVARRAGYLTQKEDAFGRKVDAYDDIVLVDLGAKPASTNPIVTIDGVTGETSLYAAKLAMDGFHGVSLAGQDLVKVFLPDFKSPGAVKLGEVELVAATALKATKAAGVLRKIKVQ